MDAEFWHQRWRDNQIGFHQGRTNALLEAHFGELALARGARVFLPLCGKTRDIAWLVAQGFRISGIELSRIAVEQLFADLALAPETIPVGGLILYRAADIAIFAGDLFDLDAAALGAVDAVYDRAALVALPADTRPRYAAHLAAITGDAPQFLVSFDYDQQAMAGPPFSVPEREIRELYRATHAVSLAGRRDVEGGLKGFCPAREEAWLLKADIAS